MVNRPFIYKALHFPEQMTDEDIDGVAKCLKVTGFLYDEEFSKLTSFSLASNGL